MLQQQRSIVDLESADEYAGQQSASQVELEPIDIYFRKARADAHRAKARTANWVALILVLGLVLSLPFYVMAVSTSIQKRRQPKLNA